MGKGSRGKRGKKSLHGKRKQRKKRLAGRYEDSGKIESLKPEISPEPVDLDMESYITFENTRQKKGPVPKNPSEEQIPPYLKRHCSKAVETGGMRYCDIECPINDFCPNDSPGNLRIEREHTSEAFDLVYREEEIERKKYLFESKQGGVPSEFETTSLRRAWKEYWGLIIEGPVPKESIRVYINNEEITREEFEKLCEDL